MDVQQTARRILGNKFVIAGSIATHGPSKLYRATQADTGRLVALREFAPHDASVEETIRLLTRMAAISSRFLVDLVDAGRVDDTTVFVSHALLEGDSLSDRLARRGVLPPPEAAALTARMLKGLDSLHRRDLVHGGLRPTRVFHEKARTGGWHVKLLGACVASVTRDEAAADRELVHYAPPEWIAGGAWAARGDVWCAAAILYKCITSKSPFGDGPPAEIAQRARVGDIALAELADKGLADGLSKLIADALSPDPEVRPANAGMMLDQLLVIYPQQQSKVREPAATQEHWTHGGVVGRPAAPLKLPPVPESRTTVTRKQDAAVRRATVRAAVITALIAAGLVFAMYAYTRNREREITARAEQRAREVALERRPPMAPTAQTAPTPILPAVVPTLVQTPVAPTVTADSGAAPAHRSPTIIARTAPPRTSPAASPPVAPATPSPSGSGMFEFRATNACNLMLDGVARGRVSMASFPLSSGTHQLTCNAGRNAERLVVRVYPGRVTRVRFTSTGETEVFTEDMPTP